VKEEEATVKLKRSYIGKIDKLMKLVNGFNDSIIHLAEDQE